MPLTQTESAAAAALNSLLWYPPASALAGDLLRFDGSAWANSAATLSGLHDVSPAVGGRPGQRLAFDGARWVAGDAALSTLADVSLAAPVAAGEQLVASEGAWENRTVAAPTTFSGLADISALGPVRPNDVLGWASGQWTNVAARLSTLADTGGVHAAPPGGNILLYNGGSALADGGGPSYFSSFADLADGSPTEGLVWGFSDSVWKGARQNLSQLFDISLPPSGVLTWDGARWTGAPGARASFSGLDDISGLAPAARQVMTRGPGGWGCASQWLSQMADASVVGAAPGEVLTHAHSRWENRAPPQHCTAFSELADISGLAPAPRDVLTFSATGWGAAPPAPLTALADVALSLPVADGQRLTSEGGKWTNRTAAFSGLADIAALSPAPHDAMCFVGGRWTAAPEMLSRLADVSVAPRDRDQLGRAASAWTNLPEPQFSSMRDVAGPSAGQALMFTGGEWRPDWPRLPQLGDVSVAAAPPTGECLAFLGEGQGWASGAEPGTAFSSLTDIAALAPAAGHCMGYAAAQWTSLTRWLSALADASVVAPGAEDVLLVSASSRWANAPMVGSGSSTTAAPSQSAVAAQWGPDAPLTNPGTVSADADNLYNSAATQFMDVTGVMGAASRTVYGIGFGTPAAPIAPTDGARLVVQWAPAAYANTQLTFKNAVHLNDSFPPVHQVTRPPAHPVLTRNRATVTARYFATYEFRFAAGLGSFGGAWIMI